MNTWLKDVASIDAPRRRFAHDTEHDNAVALKQYLDGLAAHGRHKEPK